ncbi:autophagy-related protein 27 [Umbelopsis sp. PMI_123]|nr:autophagy-related protein 27 [Umbelopsis sp. PMI_123]
MQLKSSFIIAASLFAVIASAAPDFCTPGYQPIQDSNLKLDLSKLSRPEGIQILTEMSTPPTTTKTEVKVNLCGPLNRPEGADQDYCKAGAYVCRRVINVKDGNERVTEVQDIAGEIEGSSLDSLLTLPENEKDLSKNGVQYVITLKGGKVLDTPQSTKITMECDANGDKNADPPTKPTVNSYTNGVLDLYWKTPFACATTEQIPNQPDNGGNDNAGSGGGGMSGVGIFFLIVGLLIAFYFIGGAFYNYKQYNARGLDLIPHRDFWLDLPYLIKDLFSHLMESISSRRRAGDGYVAV